MDEKIPVIDHQGAMERLDGDEELWMEIRTIWVEDVPQMLEAVRVAHGSRDAEKLRRAAHALKGASSNVGATRVAECARRIEVEAPSSDWASLEAAVDELGREVSRALEAVAASGP